jgi:hypothetical protein
VPRDNKKRILLATIWPEVATYASLIKLAEKTIMNHEVNLVARVAQGLLALAAAGATVLILQLAMKAA